MIFLTSVVGFAAPVAVSYTHLPFCTIEELRDKAYAMVGEPDPVQFDDRIVGVIEARDGTIIDVVRQIKEMCIRDSILRFLCIFP